MKVYSSSFAFLFLLLFVCFYFLFYSLLFLFFSFDSHLSKQIEKRSELPFLCFLFFFFDSFFHFIFIFIFIFIFKPHKQIDKRSKLTFAERKTKRRLDNKDQQRKQIKKNKTKQRKKNKKKTKRKQKGNEGSIPSSQVISCSIVILDYLCNDTCSCMLKHISAQLEHFSFWFH